MGNCCGCLNGSTNTSHDEYAPIVTTVDPSVIHKSAERLLSGTNYYQTILDEATSNFINSKCSTAKPDSEVHEEAKSKFANITLSPSAILSPISSSSKLIGSDRTGGVQELMKIQGHTQMKEAVDDIGSIVQRSGAPTEKNSFPAALVSFKRSDI